MLRTVVAGLFSWSQAPDTIETGVNGASLPTSKTDTMLRLHYITSCDESVGSNTALAELMTRERLPAPVRR